MEMTKSEELASVRTYLLSEYRRLYHLSDDLLYSDDDNAHHDWVYTSGERAAIARLIGFMGMDLPQIENK